MCSAILIPQIASAQPPSLTPNKWTMATQLADSNAVNDAGNCGGTPCGRAWFPMDYHAGVQRTIVYGGSVAGGCGAGYINDVWELSYDQPKNGWQWNQRKAINRGSGWPQGMDNHVMTYDAVNQYMWIFGGTCGGGFGYYNYATNSFTQVGNYNSADTNEPNDGVFDPGFAWGNGEIVVFSGEPSWYENPGERTSKFDTSKTTPAGWSIALSGTTPPPREQIEEVMVYIPTTDRFLIFGGQVSGNSNASHNDTWEYNSKANTWTKISTSSTPPARQMHFMVYDSTHDVVIMHGGSGSCGDPCSDTWAYQPHTKVWTQIAGANGPARRLHGGAYDRANDAVILWSGKSATEDSQDLYIFRYAPSGGTGPVPGAPATPRVEKVGG